MQSHDDELVRDLENALYWLPAPILLISAAAGGRKNVMIATRGMQYLDPPESTLLIGVARHSITGGLIAASGEFGLNVLASTQLDVLQRARETARIPSDQVDKFAAMGVETFQGDVTRVPLVKGCAANLECKVLNKLDAGDDYYLVVGDIVALHGFPARAPLVMLRRTSFALHSLP
jgi:flavin reductase (DIM6/NTAB) family NADH-FMN oxidoreductase RutF